MYKMFTYNPIYLKLGHIQFDIRIPKSINLYFLNDRMLNSIMDYRILLFNVFLNNFNH